MCFFAIAMTNSFAGPRLSDGPEVAGSTCPPFDAPEGHIDRSMSFDIKTESHLKESFGFNNVSKMCLKVKIAPCRDHEQQLTSLSWLEDL
jgi:hypothetical protein